jgi:hypothetical protein
MSPDKSQIPIRVYITTRAVEIKPACIRLVCLLPNPDCTENENHHQPYNHGFPAA